MLHDDEVRVDTATVRRLIQEHFPTLVCEEITPFQAGTDDAVFRIGRLAPARFPLRGADAKVCADALRREAQALQELSGYYPVSTSRPIGLEQLGRGYPRPRSMQSWVEGIPATPQGLSRSGTFALDIANLISAL
ncbi:phosphotransferase [Devosia crocina]|uniref:phosphotransferase n=1 Tax=Devosia crocina TaxID=429728 RepID=UPI000B84A576|nr:phosphotransferase [Devosia crocina]